MDCIGQVREDAPQCCLFAEAMVLPVVKKSPGLTSKTPGIVGHFMITFALDLPGRLQGDLAEKRKRDSPKPSFKDQIPICRSQGVMSPSPFSHLQKQDGGSSTGLRSAYFRFFNKEFCQGLWAEQAPRLMKELCNSSTFCESWLPCPTRKSGSCLRKAEASQSFTHSRVWPQSHPTVKAGENTWKAV